MSDHDLTLEENVVSIEAAAPLSQSMLSDVTPRVPRVKSPVRRSRSRSPLKRTSKSTTYQCHWRSCPSIYSFDSRVQLAQHVATHIQPIEDKNLTELLERLYKDQDKDSKTFSLDQVMQWVKEKDEVMLDSLIAMQAAHVAASAENPKKQKSSEYLESSTKRAKPSPDETVCILCHQGHSRFGNRIVLCDKCDTAYHQMCHTPRIPHTVITDPDARWECAKCAPQ